jgi:hypothetical protein
MTTDRSGLVRLSCAAVLAFAAAPLLAEGPVDALSSLRLSLASALEGSPGAGFVAQAQPGGQPPGGPGAGGESMTNRIGARAGVGFTADPGSFLTSILADFRVLPTLSVGPLMQFGISGNTFLIAPTLNVQYTLPVTVNGAEQLKPFAQGGMGLVYIEKDLPGPNAYDTDFLINFGLGADYWLNNRMAVGSNFLFNFVPGKVLDEAFFLSWQFLTFRYNF